MRLGWDQVRARRLERHFLSRRAPPERLVDVVRGICGIHAQVRPSAELALGLRVDGFTRRDLAAALWERRTLVKTYGIRGTVHLFPSDELGLWLSAFAANRRADDERRLAYLGLSREQMDAIIEAIGDALEERRLSRDELGAQVARRVGAAVVERTVSAFGGRWPVWTSGLGAAANSGRLCFGPTEGTRVTFESPRRWLGASKQVDGTDALREIFRRYLAAYGPARHDHFAQWFAMPASRARDLADSLGDELRTVEVDGTRLLQLARDDSIRPRPARGVLLLPRFDPFVVGSHPRDELVPPDTVARARATGLLPQRAGTGRQFLVGPMPVLLVDGAVAGVWEQRRARGRVDLRVQAFVRLAAEERDGVEAAAARVGAVLEEEVRLSFGEISTRPHL